MKITVSGTVKEYPLNSTVADLINSENVETPQYVTVAVNDEFIDSALVPTTTLQNGDTVEFLYFMGGGQ